MSYDLVFNDMLLRMLHGDYTINPLYIKEEAFFANGQAHAYFGPLPALLRAPLGAVFDLSRQPVSILTCLIASVGTVIFNLASILLVTKRAPAAIIVALCAAVAFSGMPMLLVGSPVIFNEAVLWAGLLVSAYLYVLVRALLQGGSIGAPTLSLLAVIAGLCVLARVSTALGLCLSTVLLTLYETGLRLRAGSGELSVGAAVRSGLGPVVALAFFCAVTAYVNYRRWGHPLEFMNLARNSLIVNFPTRVHRLQTEGQFNVGRLWFGVQYYFFPVWRLKPSLFAGWIGTHLDGAEGPFCCIPLTELPLFGLGVAGAAQFARARVWDEANIRWGLSAAGFLAPAVLILMNIFMALRYSVEFAALLHLFAFFGASNLVAGPRGSAIKWRAPILVAALVAIAATQFTLHNFQAWNGVWTMEGLRYSDGPRPWVPTAAKAVVGAAPVRVRS